MLIGVAQSDEAWPPQCKAEEPPLHDAQGIEGNTAKRFRPLRAEQIVKTGSVEMTAYLFMTVSVSAVAIHGFVIEQALSA
jgi:hypothetical protein